MANQIAHFSCCRSPFPDLSVFSLLFLCCLIAFCSLFLSVLSWEEISQGSQELFVIWSRTTRVCMVAWKIAILDLLETCVPCAIVLWVLRVEGASLMVPVLIFHHLHNLRSGRSNCCSRNKRTWRSLNAFRASLHIRQWKSPRDNGHRILSFILQGTKKLTILTRWPQGGVQLYNTSLKIEASKT